MAVQIWHKQCKCGNFMLDEYEICDDCLLSKYKLRGRYDSCDLEGLGHTYYTGEDVIIVLREAEKNK